MNVWRCVNRTCRSMFTDREVGHASKLLICTDCGSMVCNVTSTRMAREYLAAKQKHVPSRVRLQHMDKRFVS